MDNNGDVVPVTVVVQYPWGVATPESATDGENSSVTLTGVDITLTQVA